MTLRPCLNLETLQIHTLHIENIDLNKYEVIGGGIEGNRGTIDMTTGSIINKPSAFSERSAELLAEQEAAIVSEALSKNNSKKKV